MFQSLFGGLRVYLTSSEVWTVSGSEVGVRAGGSTGG